MFIFDYISIICGLRQLTTSLLKSFFKELNCVYNKNSHVTINNNVFRANPNSPQIITMGNANSVWSSNYWSGRPLIVLVHGWNGSGNSGINTYLVPAFLDVMDCNVIVVDWKNSASGLYTTSVLAVPSVGQYLGNFLVWLVNTAGGNWNNIHLVGFSLGAHIVGNAGRITGGQVSRITGKLTIVPVPGFINLIFVSLSAHNIM